ncbi:LOW QUALITY PROTEIN: ankyrin repeat, SAM and basic leucine zipper domain-containing protein 1 [Thalassophryne amazonica]|uniref:LOW QUALITY PROTEIN: ankyrin repeat, SAM and basic leucine zipper domain-containing protein 1 n=1 Tax=Thalassophryne amazonica TaxID=390379 RepID=UPI0014726379|nr:LOW QUALITY PROTEIN: ankyrin repeat, SAM and basic leucine zipper domain-containing protein 1 [Thalassophryne amazonica]
MCPPCFILLWKDLDGDVPRAENDVLLLKQAIGKGDVEAVEKLLDSGIDVETKLDCEWTPLMCAVSVANYDLTKLLLDRGASANFSKDEQTLLMASCSASATEDKIAHCVELLLSRSADPNIVDRSRMTCLMLAAKNGYSKVINLLVSYGAEINVQDHNGEKALSKAVHYGREEAVLKLLQLGADKTIKTKCGKSPADLALRFSHSQILRILAPSQHNTSVQASTTTETTASEFFIPTSQRPSSKESVTKLEDLELLLHGLDLGNLSDIMHEHNITWTCLLTMDKTDLEKIGVTDPVDQEKVLSAVQHMQMDTVDLDTIKHLGVTDSGSEDLYNFLISVRQQCCYLTEMIQDVINRFPQHASQVVFRLDPNKEAQAVCNQLVVQCRDLQREIICLRSLLCQIDKSEDGCLLHPPDSGRHWRMPSLTSVMLGVVGAGVIFFLLNKTSSGKFELLMHSDVC